MNENTFRRWRSQLGLDLADASKALGKSRRMVEYYDAGRTPPLDTRLLMGAIAHGVQPKSRPLPWPEM